MNFEDITKQEVLDFLETQVTCTIATNGNGGYPNSATVAFSNNDKFEFVIGTNVHSRKAKNVETNSKVAMTITDVQKRWTLQLEGDIRKLDPQEFADNYGQHHYAKLPFSLPFKDIPDQANYLIVPVHMKLTEANKQPWVVHEILQS